jgi:hypothetical protein
MSNQPAPNPSQSNASVQTGGGQQPLPGAPGNKGDQDDRQDGQRSASQSGRSDQRQAQSNNVVEDSVESEGDPSAVIDKQGH